MSKIRFIVHVVSSAFDRNGNRSHFAHLTSTKTGKQITVRDIGGPNGMRYALSQALGRDFDTNYPNVYSTESEDVPRRQFAAALRSYTSSTIWEHQLSRTVIEQLETEGTEP